MLYISPRETSQQLDRQMFDLVVVGGGIAGIAIARAVAQEGKLVLLLEKADVLGLQQSTKNHNWLHPGTRHALKHPEIARSLLESSKQIFADLNGLVDPTSVYYLASDSTAESYKDAWTRLEIPFEEVDFKMILRKNPALSGSPPQRSFLTEDKLFSPSKLLTNLCNQIIETGNALLMRNAEAAALIIDSNGSIAGVQVREPRSGEEWRVEAELIICATGSRTQQLLNTAGVRLSASDLKLFKAHLIVSNQLTESMLVCLDDPFQVVVPRSNPVVSVLDSASDHEISNPDDLKPEAAVVDGILHSIRELLPQAEIDWHQAYCCVKAEYIGNGAGSDERGKKPGVSIIEPLPGLLCVWPGKLSAYPILVKEVMDYVKNRSFWSV